MPLLAFQRLPDNWTIKTGLNCEELKSVVLALDWKYPDLRNLITLFSVDFHWAHVRQIRNLNLP